MKSKLFIIIGAVLVVCAIVLGGLYISGKSGTAMFDKQQPLSAAELLDLGEKYLLELNYKQALVQFLKVIEVEPMNPRGYTGAAEAYVELGETEKAISVLQDGLKAIPGNAELQMMFQKFQTPEQKSISEPILDSENKPITVSRENPITISGRIDRKSILFADKFNEYKGVYESEDGKTFLSDGTCILFDSLVDVIIDGEAITLNGAILATSEISDYIGHHVTITGYFSKQDYKFQQEITGPYSLAELLDNPDEDGYVYYFNAVGSYLLVIDEIVDLATDAMPDDMHSAPDLINQDEADIMALTAFESAYFTVDSSGAYSIEIDLPSLPVGYYWDVDANIRFPDYMLGLVQNGREYRYDGGGHLSASLTYKEENDLGDTLAGLSLYITTGEPVNNRRGLFDYSSVQVYAREKTNYFGEDGLSAMNNMLDEWKTIEFNNAKLFSAISSSIE